MLMTAIAGMAMGVQGGIAATAPRIETPAAEHDKARELLATLAGGDAARIEAFVETSFAPPSAGMEPAADRLKRLQALARQSGGLDVRNWEPDGERLFFSGTTRKGGVPVEGMVVLRENKIAVFDLQRDLRHRPADAPAWPLQASDAQEAVKAIRKEIDWRAKAERFSGAVLIAHKGTPVLHDAWGTARRSPDALNRVDTLFHTASATKMLTSAAVARLIDAGRLRLDMPVAQAVPALAGSAGAAQTAIGDLLGHRVSYGEYFEQKSADPLLATHRRATELLPLLKGREPERPTEGPISYSNANYLVLAAAVEAATGQSFYDYVEAEVMRPLGMSRTTYGQAALRPAGAATGWIKDELGDPLAIGPWQSNDGAIGTFRGGPAGGAWSTAEEMWRLIDGVAAGKLIEPATLTAMLNDRKRVGPTLGSALGFMTRGGEKLSYFGHAGGGGNAGMSTAAFIAPDREWAVVVLSNFSSPAGEMLAGQILDFLAQMPR